MAHDAEIDEFEDISDAATVIYAENLNQGHDMLLGERVKLTLTEMTQLKNIIDKEINPDFTGAEKKLFNVQTTEIPHVRIALNNSKLTNIPVGVENLNGRILVTVGPCDLSGVGGHQIREQMIKNLVTQALNTHGPDTQGVQYENVHVSACVGVRGRAQMVLGMFANNREQAGNHMNAYVKTANEKFLTHWEPRKGPQRWYNDTICAMVTSTTTSLFEQRVRTDAIRSAAQATTEILKHDSLRTIFDRLLSQTKDRVTDLISNITSMMTVGKSLK